MQKRCLQLLFSGKHVYLLAVAICYSLVAFAQQAVTVTGTVIDADDGSAIPGVNVLVQGTQQGTITDVDGKYSIKAAPGATLVFTYVGYVKRQVEVGNQTTIDVSLAPDVQALDEVVVVGYGTQNQRNLTSSISRVTSSEFKETPVTTVDQALQGRATGVQVVESSGEPGADVVLRIRGNNSLSGNNEPLYVIDGFPMPPYQEAPTNSYGSYRQNGLYGINPNDIASIEVLKDAAATAIYGSRGANGVVLITTKAGKRGEGRVELVNKTSVGYVSRPATMMSGMQYAKVRNEFAELTSNTPAYDLDTINTNTDWFGAVTRPSFRQDVSLSVSGGGPKSSYYISGNYLQDKGVLLGSDLNRGSLRVNVNNDVNNWYTAKLQVSLVRQTSNRAITSSRGWPQVAGPVMDALRANPLLPKDFVGEEGGTGGFGKGFFFNPYIELTGKTDDQKNDNIVGNLENWFHLRNDLQLVVTVGANQNLTRRQVFFTSQMNNGYFSNGQASSSLSNTYSYNMNAYFLYDKDLGEYHKLNTTLGAEYNLSQLELLNTQGSDYDIQFMGVNNLGIAKSQQIGSHREDRTIQSGFFRANYSYKTKYILNASVRLDGASPFAANKKYAVFPAVGLAWNLNEEEFMKNVNFLNNAKVRLSYGSTGSQAISPYSSLAKYGTAFYQIGNPGQVVTAVFPVSLGNPDLTWERTNQWNAGVDLNVLNNRLNVSFDYYSKLTEGLLQARSLPSQSGFGAITDNLGTMRNSGLELSLEGVLVQKENLQLTTRVNVTKNQNVLVSLGENDASQYFALGGNLLGGVSHIMTPGEQLGNFYGYKVIGLAQPSDFEADEAPLYPYPGGVSNQIPGTWKYEDVNKDGIINADDRTILGNGNPDFIFGWTTDFVWRRLGVNLFFTGSVGNEVLNITDFYVNSGLLNYHGVFFNQTEEWYNKRWTTSNQHNDPHFPSLQRGIAVGDINSAMVEDGSFLRLKMLTLNYNFPDVKVLKNPQLFLTASNLFTITKYRGFDPEVSSYGQSVTQPGIDYGTYPRSRTFTLGLSCSF